MVIPKLNSTRKGKWLIFHYFSFKSLKMETSLMTCSMVDCTTQQTFRVFLTRIFNLISSELIDSCDRVFAWNKIDHT